MQDRLAEQLLAKVLGWDADDLDRETPRLQAIARYKYDSYQQFHPGRRFVESLALWLQQFRTPEERRTAFRFAIDRVVFVSQAEMSHLVNSAYVDLMRPEIIRQAAERLHVPSYRVARICSSTEFRVLRRQTLFLGLSDGSRIDQLRRASRDVSHEQVYQTHELSPARACKLQQALVQDLRVLLNREPTYEEARFRVVFLVDDFTGSGFTYLRKGSEPSSFKGKLAGFYEEASTEGSPLSRLVTLPEARVYVVFYMAFSQGVEHLRRTLPEMWRRGQYPEVLVGAHVPPEVSVTPTRDPDFYVLCQDDGYYDGDALEDRHTAVGGGNARLGFAGCALPIVMAHNTPNNSISLLWAYDTAKFRGLFPRVPRHIEV